ncbi:MAG TPA: alpha-2-macroglobulin family protein [Pyrinomonadaceae bacterium]|nr:alpha-2-macroglobulin family protein [Pyrinomonadaceae bacterium]
MKIIISISLAFFLFLNGAPQQGDYSQLKAEAEKLYTQASFARANEIYKRVDKSALTALDARWVDFRIADTAWRSQAATATSDPTVFEQAQKQLEELIRVSDKDEDRDLVWAEAHESLGDFFWTRRDQLNWANAWPHCNQALDWWAGQRDFDRARERYLKIVFTASQPPSPHEYYVYTYHGNYIPLEVLENALKISQRQDDKVRIHYLIAMTMRNTGGDWESRNRVADEFEAALAAGKKADWYDDALYHYAEWMTNYGRIVQTAENQWINEPDFVRALELYRRLLREFVKGETRYYDHAEQQIRNITTASLGVGVSNVFLPGSEIQFGFTSRNIKRVDFSIYRVNLPRDIRFTKITGEDEGEAEDGDWIKRLPTTDLVKSWIKNLNVKDDYKMISEQVRIDGQLPVGAYLLQAKSGELTSREVILVTDVSVVIKSSPTQALVYFSNAFSGAPVPNANVVLWESYHLEGRWRWRKLQQATNGDGLASFVLRSTTSYRNLFVAAESDQRQAFTAANGSGRETSDGWRIYAFTDRPAYRPRETVQWKFIARRMSTGAYSTPANEMIEYEITDPRGTKLTAGKATLNSFGSAWSSVELGEQLPLGEYQVQFWDQNRANSIGNATLFRLEEYKLPEFRVAVKTPEQDGKKKSFRLGEKVEVNIQADYYFGGPVSNASVEVVVRQSPFFHYWFPHREYPWYYNDLENLRQRHSYYGSGSIIKRETIKTDATGKATLVFDTPRENYNQDFEYRIEARVTDSSRREILASDTVRVTRHRYYVYPRPERNIYRPKDRVKVDIKALDANEQPVEVEGSVKVTRDYWWEVWIDPSGREVKGEELRLLQQKRDFYRVPKGQKPWRLKFRGYQSDDVLTQTVKTDKNGNAQFTFTAEREGYYRVKWQSPQTAATNATDPVAARRNRFLPPITAETYVFVGTNASNDLGYRNQGLEIIVDKDTLRAGQTTPVMLSVPFSDRYVLFSVEGEDLFSYKLVHVTGLAKLIEVPIEEKHIPNVYFTAVMVSEAQTFGDTEQIVVPPVEQFLAVDVKSDREQYQPREEGTLAITTRDFAGRPVSAEIALGLIDESVKYVQQDYAIDPRQFYYGNKRTLRVQTQSSFNQKPYARLVEGPNKQLIDEKALLAQQRLKDQLGPRNAPGEMEELASYSRAAGMSNRDTKNLYRLDGMSVQETVTVTADASVSDFAVPTNGRRENFGFLKPGANAGGGDPAVQVRSDFRSTILWMPDLKTDAAGFASVKVKYPDSLTTWQATARVASAGNQFGIGNTATRTKQPLIVRLQAPRFFVVGDQATISAVINNNTDQAMTVSPALTAEGLTFGGVIFNGQPMKSDKPAIEVKANSEARADWIVSVTHASEAKLKVEARGGQYADAMEKTYPVFDHGIEKFVSRSGKMRSDSVAVNLDIPRARRTETTELSVQVAPSMATTMLDALPYLIDYPYGCTEQTMSRFLPAVITAKTLRDLGMKPETAMHKVFGGVEQDTAAATHPKGKRDLSELEAITKQSLARLYNFQHADGGWGWWKEGESDHFMTAYVLWGMTLARQAGIDVKSDVVARAASFLDKEIVEEETNYDSQAWVLHALAVYHSSSKSNSAGAAAPSAFQAKAFDNLWTNREKLNAYTRALLALSAHHFGYPDKAKTLVQNLENGVKVDTKPDTSIVQTGGRASDPSVMATAHWGEDGIYWRWSDGGVEATSFVLRALLAIDPGNKLIEPVTNWLIKNRRGAQWSNTRDTAIVVLTLNDYLRASGEVAPRLGYELLVNGKSIATKQLTADDALSAPSKFAIPREIIRDGGNEITIRRTSGTGPIYFSAEAKFFSLEEPLTPAGNEIFVRRQYFKLVNHPTLLKGYVSERVPLNDGESVKSGDRVEVVVTVEAKNNYEYLIFEDLKPGGLEAVQIRSGESLYAREIKSGALNSPKAALMNYKSASDFTGRNRWVYQELRDRKVALFLDKLPEGVWQMSYEMRAEAPGTFHALPVLGHAMYVPEIRTNSAEVRVRVVD